jgi:hypothetical protein
MGLNRAFGDNQETELGLPCEPLRGDSLEKEVENQLRNLDRLVESVGSARDQASFPSKPHAHNLVNNLRTKLKASHDMFRLAKLLSEPVRTSMFSKVHESLNDLEEDIAAHWNVKTH